MGVSLKKISGRSEEVNYPWEEIEQARARDEYLREGGRFDVQWIGNAGGRGFTGEPTQEDAHLLLNGKAADGERLLPAAVVQGIDLTFSVPKPVSILHAVSGPEERHRLERAISTAFDLTMQKLEQHLLFVRVGSGRREVEREVVHASGIVGIRYQHPYSREGDPQFHYHAMISSVVQDPDGNLRRMWMRDMGEMRRTLGYWNEAFLREEISKEFPGLRWEPVQQNGTADIAQVPASLCSELSTRSRRIKAETETWEKNHGRRANSAVKQMLTLQTRPRKPEVPDQAQWTADVVAIANEHGLSQEVIRDEIWNAPPAIAHDRPTEREIADRLLGPDGLTATSPRFRSTDVIVGVIQAGVAGSDVEGYVETILADGRVHAIKTLKGITYVTEELVQAELAVERFVRDGIAKTPQLALTSNAASVAIESVDFELTDGQRRVIFDAATSPDQVVMIEAGAGTGKTTAAGVIRAALETDGIQTRGAAPTGKAAVELASGAGIDSRTVDSLLWEADNGGSLSDDGRIKALILDEAGMLDTRKFARLCGHLEREHMRLIVFGDSNQLVSVAPGGWLGYFSRTGKRPALRMDEVVRQRDPEHRKAVMDLARGLPRTWINYQVERGNVIHLGAGQEHHYAQRAAELLAEAAGRHGWNHVLAITPTNMRREAINESVQQRRLAQDELGPRLAESNEHELFHAGDRVMYTGRNSRQRSLQNGLTGTAVGETEQGELVIALNEEQTQLRTLSSEQVAQHLRLAYAVTDYKGQGTTVQEAVMVAAPDELDLNRGYVAASRAREQTKLVLISDAGIERACQTLARRLRTRDDDELAIEHIQHAKEATMTTTPATTPARTRTAEPWLSTHRKRIAQLDEERAALTPIWQADTSQYERQLDAISSRRRAITNEDRNDYGILRARGRREREQARDLELQRLASEERRLRAESSLIADRQVDDFNAWDRIRRERAELVELAGTEEFQRRVVGQQAPWLEEAIGPRPSGQRGLLQRWHRVGEYLARVRVDRAVSDPTDTGLTTSDGTLLNDIRTLRGHIERARELGSEARSVDLMESKEYRPGRLELPGLGANGRALGFEIGE